MMPMPLTKVTLSTAVPAEPSRPEAIVSLVTARAFPMTQESVKALLPKFDHI